MFRQRWTMPLFALLLVLAAGGVAACSGGDDDNNESKIEARTKTFFGHLTKGDAKGLISDIPPSARSGCDEAKIKEAAAQLSAFKFQLKSTKVTAVNGDTATADITVSTTIGEESSEDTSQQKYVKVDGNWYLDPEGKSCAEMFT